jgi:hypothetical protein
MTVARGVKSWRQSHQVWRPGGGQRKPERAGPLARGFKGALTMAKSSPEHSMNVASWKA